jgi:hypothetical protein
MMAKKPAKKEAAPPAPKKPKAFKVGKNKMGGLVPTRLIGKGFKAV